MSDTTLSAIIPADTAGGCRDPAPAIGLDEGAPEERRAVSLAERLKALADPTRLRMLDLLARHGSRCASARSRRASAAPADDRHHIRLLREAGLVAGEKRGVWSYYWATDAGQRCLVALAALG